MATPLVSAGRKAATRALFLLGIILASTRPASAELGGGLDSVYRDSARMNASIQVRNAERYRIYEITTAAGTTVREFVSPTGTVFGIAWEGHFVPEMKQLLGASFEPYSTAVRAQTSKYAGRRPLSIHSPTLVFESAGHMGWYYGRAYIPEIVPQGSTQQEIR